MSTPMSNQDPLLPFCLCVIGLYVMIGGIKYCISTKKPECSWCQSTSHQMRGLTAQDDCPLFQAERFKLNEASHCGPLTYDEVQGYSSVGLLITSKVGDQNFVLCQRSLKGVKYAYEFPSAKRMLRDQEPVDLVTQILEGFLDAIPEYVIADSIWYAPGKYVLLRLNLTKTLLLQPNQINNQVELVNINALTEENMHSFALRGLCSASLAPRANEEDMV
jgi:hypothetical protein